ncbi:hypothetical protein OQA88_957 [Cercophora sp. LCS_1]
MNALQNVGREARTKGLIPIVLSYAFDWVLLGVGAGVGYVLGDITPNKRPFSVDDRAIGFPYTNGSTVPNWLLIVCSAVVPILIIVVLSLILNPGVSDPPKSVVWTRKIWELHAGWIGLALSLVSTWIVTNGLKGLIGKPRPDMLARCRPDLANLSSYFVGENPFSNSSALVRASICTNPDVDLVNDGFRAYPSGHASLSAAGLVYLTLFLFSKFGITIPLFYLAGSATSSRPATTNRVETSKASTNVPTQKRPVPSTQRGEFENEEAAAPPLYLLLIAVVPFFTAIFIGVSRWFDFRHSGFDIISGFIIGGAAAFFAFRYYHMPLSQYAGRALRPRSAGKAFWPGSHKVSSPTDCARCGGRSRDEEVAEDAIHNGQSTAFQGSQVVIAKDQQVLETEIFTEEHAFSRSGASRRNPKGGIIRRLEAPNHVCLRVRNNPAKQLKALRKLESLKMMGTGGYKKEARRFAKWSRKSSASSPSNGPESQPFPVEQDSRFNSCDESFKIIAHASLTKTVGGGATSVTSAGQGTSFGKQWHRMYWTPTLYCLCTSTITFEPSTFYHTLESTTTITEVSTTSYETTSTTVLTITTTSSSIYDTTEYSTTIFPSTSTTTSTSISTPATSYSTSTCR